MTAEDHFREGRLADAIAAQNQQVRAKPADADARFLLFVLLCFAGELERAEKQLDVLASQDEGTLRGGLVYRSLLAAELERRNVFEGRGRPVLPPDSPASVERRLEALALLRAGQEAEAEARIDAAVEVTPPCRGALNGRSFEGLRDYDDVLGSVLEVFAGGRYLWLPFERVRRLGVGEPESALDTLWVPAELVDAEGVRANVHVPALYAGSHAHDDDAVRLGRRTEWNERGALYLGAGQRILLSASEQGTEEHPLLSLRSLELSGEAG